MSEKSSDSGGSTGSSPESPPRASPTPRRRRRWLRWTLLSLLGLLGLVVVLVGGALIYVQTAPGSAKVLALGLRAANEALAGKLTVGALELHGGHIVLRDVTLRTPEGERVAHVDLLEVRVRILPLIGKTVYLEVVRIERPELWLEIDDRGMNLTRAVAARNPKPPEPSSGPLPFTFVVDSLSLQRGSVRVVQGTGEEARKVAITGLGLRLSGRYAGPTGAFEAQLDGSGAVSGLLDGPLQLAVRGKGDDRAREASVDLGLAGLVLRGSGAQRGTSLQAKIGRLLVPPAVGRALTPAWTPKVPVELSGEGALDGDAAQAELKGRAGSAQLALQARGNVRAPSVEKGHLELRHVNLSQLLADGPVSDLGLTADLRGGGKSLETLTGAADLSMPPSEIRKATVGPVELHASADRGTYELRDLRAILPGVKVTGQGRGTAQAIKVALDVEAKDLTQLARTFGSLSAAQLPPLAGSGTLHVEGSGPIRHPGVSVRGRFASLRVSDVRARSLSISAHIPDIDRPLDANAQINADQLRLGQRVLRPVAFTLLTRGRALDLHAGTGGFFPLEVHLGGTVDEDRRGIRMEALTIRYPEASWSMEAPARLRFGGNVLELQPLRVVSEEQAIRLGGWKRGDRIDASVGLEALELGKLPHALVPPSTPLSGRVSLDARARGTLAAPSVEATVDAVDVTAGKVQHLYVKGNGSWVGRRAQAKLAARGLGVQLTADVDLPVDALRTRKHDPVRAQVVMPEFQVSEVICAAVRMKLLTRGCDDDKAEVNGKAELRLDLSGHADAPVLKAEASTHGLVYRKLPPTDLTVAVEGPERGDLSVLAKGTALKGNVDLQASVGRSLARLVSDPRPAESLRTAELKARARIHDLQLKPLHDAGFIPREVDGAVSLDADLAGTGAAPTGELKLQAKQFKTPPMDPADAVLDVKAQKTVTATLEASDARGALLSASLEVGASPASLQGRQTFDDVPLRMDATVRPLDLARFPLVVGEGRLARRIRGTVEATVLARGSLQAPNLVARVRTSQLGAGDVPLGKAEIFYSYKETQNRVQAHLATVNNGDFLADASATLDLSYPAVRRGLKPGTAPFQATVTSKQFDLAFLTGFSTTLRRVSGTLDIDARASGTLEKPEGQGKVELKNGVAGIAGYGEFRNIHLLANASNDRISLDDLNVQSESGSLKLTGLGTRDGQQWTLKASGEANAFPVFTEDQLVATLSLRTEMDGIARPGFIELNKVHVPEAHVDLPTQSRRNLQSLSRPGDIILLRDGKPVDPRRVRALLAEDQTAEAALGGSGDLEPEKKPMKIVVVMDATRNLWVKSQDLNVEVGMSPDFRIEIDEGTELFGEVRIIRGRLDVLGRRFDFQKNSVVRFSGSPTEPNLNVTAIYNNVKAGVKVSMHVQGQAGDIQLVPSSEPPLTESEIYTLLATGRTSLKRGSSGSEIGSAQAVSVLGSLAASQLKSAVSDKVGLDVLSIEAGDNGLLQGASLEAGKYITDDLYLGYAGKVGADPTRYENSNAVRLEYQILPRLSFEGVYGDAHSGSADLVWTRDY